ncbi:hypothetical protein O1611_g1234 [Lasiodiplodia mahajangana]|uniref:Uncharacterized protein n=1 Tax=Lasiodiplodia mahajangana TaxID=1108764 RepID=A0ACC2JY86_9PEZI|nr:hypothetical protein O1611_g1234 [Lasiodiplodia mahajangana]
MVLPRLQHGLVEAIQPRLEQYFEDDPERRFRLESVIGRGVSGLTWKIKYMASPGANTSTQSTPQPSPRYIGALHNYSPTAAVKMDYSPPNVGGFLGYDNNSGGPESGDFEREREEMREEYRREREALQALRWAKHMVTAVVVPNDPLTQGVECLRPHGMIRMVIALGWPPRRPEGGDPQPVIEQINGPAYGAYVHADLFLDPYDRRPATRAGAHA